MKQFIVKGLEGTSLIMVGESLSKLTSYIPKKNILIITDENVNGLYKSFFSDYPVIEIAGGEENKTIANVEIAVSKLLQLGVDRSWFIVAVGGGIVCDIAGFLASIYMRGIRYGFVATTLLAQVDAAIGGKNGVNFQGYKNIIGVFNQPEFVICDVSLLKTLAKDDVLCGLAEIIKHALLADKEMFSILENKKEDILALKDEVIEELVYRSVKIKSAVVNEDEREQGKRKLLNLGHTIGHAVEKTYSVSHGKAVAIGIRYAVQLSVNKKYLDKQVAERIISLLDAYNFSDLKVDESKIFSAILKDKKKTGTFLSFIFLRNIGEPIIEEVTFEELKEDIYELS